MTYNHKLSFDVLHFFLSKTGFCGGNLELGRRNWKNWNGKTGTTRTAKLEQLERQNGNNWNSKTGTAKLELQNRNNWNGKTGTTGTAKLELQNRNGKTGTIGTAKLESPTTKTATALNFRSQPTTSTHQYHGRARTEAALSGKSLRTLSSPAKTAAITL